jgi:hypothetical protein
MTPHEHARISYGKQWKAKLAKKHNQLKNYVTYKGDCTGRYATIEQFGDLDLEEKTARHENTPAVELPTSRRFIFPQSFNRKVKFDEDDEWKLDSVGVPLPEAAKRLMQAGMRAMERITFAGMLDTQVVGNGPEEAMTNVALPASQIIPVGYGISSGNAGLTFAKVLEAITILMESNAWGQDIETDEPDIACMAASPRSLKGLWNEGVVTSSDFRSHTGGKPFDRGVLEDFLGVKIMVTTGLIERASGGINTVPVWMKSKVTYGDWKRATTDVWRDRDTGGDRIRFKFTGGATREEEEAVVAITVDETVN